MLRAGRPEDAERLRTVERKAGRQFTAVGMPAIAAAEPMPADVLAGFAAAGRCWVAEDVGGAVVGYAVVDEVDGCAHVEQLSVVPERQGTGLGRRLLERIEAWAREQGFPALTLTTFGDVPWNRPLYEHLGFVCVPEDELTPGLAHVREEEAAMGLDPAVRVVMRRDVRR